MHLWNHLKFCSALLLLFCVPAWASPDSKSRFAVQPFSAEANFMSGLGFLRWKHYQNTGSWLPASETIGLSDFPMSDPPDLTEVLWNLKRATERNPFANTFTIQWEIDRWGTDWHDNYVEQRIYNRATRKLYLRPEWIEYPLDDSLIAKLLEKRREIVGNDSQKRWLNWWKSQS